MNMRYVERDAYVDELEEEIDDMPDYPTRDTSLDLTRTDYIDWSDLDRSGLYEDSDK